MRTPRRDPRLLVDVPVELRGEKQLDGSVRDISQNGLRVRLAGRVQMGDRVGVTLRIPGFVEMDFAGEIRWVRRLNLGLACDAGLELDHTPPTRKRMQMLLWELESGNLSDIERRHRTTFRLSGAPA